MSEPPTVDVVIPEDVWAFAREQGVEAYLPIVLEAARRNFPDAGLRVLVEQDHEMEDLRYIVVMVRDHPGTSSNPSSRVLFGVR